MKASDVIMQGVGGRILVTGGAGFVGSALCRFPAGEIDHMPVNVDKPTGAGNLDSLRPIADNSSHDLVTRHADGRRGFGDA